MVNGKTDGATESHLLSPPGQPYDPTELQRAFAGMSARDVYTLLCKRCGCKAISSIIAVLPEKPGDWTSVTELDLSRTYIGPRGVIPLLELCKLFAGLTSINLSSNYLNNQSVWHVTKALIYHPAVQRIDLSGNEISWTAAMCVLELVTRNSNIIRVGLNDTLVLPKVVATINQQLRRNLIIGSRSNRRGPNPSNHPITIRLRSLKRFFREALAKEDNPADGRLPKTIVIDGLKECYKLTGKEQELEHRSAAFFERYLGRVETDTVDWETFMLIVLLEDVTVNPEAVDELRGVFKHFDVDDAGYVEYGDLKEMMTMLRHGAEPTDAEVLSKIEAHDADELMTMNWDEFLLLMYDKGPVVGELSTFHVHTPLKQQRSLHF